MNKDKARAAASGALSMQFGLLAGGIPGMMKVALEDTGLTDEQVELASLKLIFQLGPVARVCAKKLTHHDTPVPILDRKLIEVAARHGFKLENPHTFIDPTA